MKNAYVKPQAEWVSFRVDEALMDTITPGGGSFSGGAGVRPISDEDTIFNEDGTIG